MVNLQHIGFSLIIERLSFGGVMNFTYINGDDILDYLTDITPERVHNHRL